MLCFNYIANIIKLMGLLSREGMRDGNIGICWDAGHIGICGICGEDGGYAEICGICGTDHHPEIGPAGLPFLVSPPPAYEGLEMRTANDQQTEKKECLFCI